MLQFPDSPSEKNTLLPDCNVQSYTLCCAEIFLRHPLNPRSYHTYLLFDPGGEVLRSPAEKRKIEMPLSANYVRRAARSRRARERPCRKHPYRRGLSPCVCCPEKMGDPYVHFHQVCAKKNQKKATTCMFYVRMYTDQYTALTCNNNIFKDADTQI